MKRLLMSVSAAGLAVSLAACSMESAEMAPVAERADNFMLVDNTGFGHELRRMKEAKSVVLVAQVNGDKVSREAAVAAAALQDAHADARVFLLNSDNSDGREAIIAEVEEQGFAVPVLDDYLQLVGEDLGMSRSGQAMVIDTATWNIVYSGPLDEVATNAVASLSAGEAVEVAALPVKGTTLSFPERDAADAHANISYSETIAPILEAKCVACHQEGGIGPFAMDSYEVVKGFAPMIREAIRVDRMPPWNSDPVHGEFVGDKSMTSEEIKTVVHWIEAGAPRGEGEDLLANVEHVAPEWPLGEPDLVIDIPSYKIPASGVVDYQKPYALNPMTEGRWLKASTVKAGERQGVHHVLTGYIDNPPPGGTAPETMWGSSVGGYAVGSESVIMPENHGVWVPEGGAIGFQMHYTPFGKEAVDNSQIALYFYEDDELPDLMLRQSVVIDTMIEIEPNSARHRETAYLEFPEDALLYSAFPHAHYRGIYSDLDLVKPDGSVERLLTLPFYDFNWQRAYEFPEPIEIPAGSKLVAHYEYDNSAGNPANPDPNIKVTWGDQSFEEMLYTSVRFRWVDETAENQLDYTEQMNQGRLIGMMDDNLDGILQPEELKGRIAQMLNPYFAMVDANKDGGVDAEEFANAQKMIQSMGGRAGGAQ